MGASLDKADCLPLPTLDEAYSVVELLDGRSLAFREYGDASGVPIIFYHGNLSSRLFMPSWDETHEAAVAAGARVIAVDRPGYGRSSLHCGRAYMDNGAELRALLASVKGLAGGRRVALLGHRSGAPHALAAAYVTMVPGMACQVAAVGLASPEWPRTGKHGVCPPTPADASAAVAASYDGLCAACEELWDTWPDRSRLLAADLAEATRQGLSAAEQDYLLERSPWDFELEDVSCRVLLWQGTDLDSGEGEVTAHSLGSEALGAAPVRQMAARLPHCSASFIRGETHLLVRRRFDDILAALVDEVSRDERRQSKQGSAGEEQNVPPSISVRVDPSEAGSRPPVPLTLRSHRNQTAPPTP